MVELLGKCPLPLRLNTRIPITEDQIVLLGLKEFEGKPSLLVEKDAMFQMYVYGDKTTGEEHVAVMKGIGNGEDVPIRIHSSCLTAESFHASNCDCQEQLEVALGIVEKEGYGGVIWLHQEGRGNGLAAKAKQLQIMLEQGVNTVEAFERAGYPRDQRDYTVAADIIKSLGIKSVRLITNNPDKIQQISDLSIKVNSRIPCEIAPENEIVKRDLSAKKKMGHLLDNPEL